MKRAWITVVALGLGWAGLYATLAGLGHQPSSVRPLPIDPGGYYPLAAALIAPLVVALWQIAGRVTHATATRLGGRGTGEATLAAVGPAWALPLLAGLVVPDLVVLLGWGFEALAPAMRYYAPAALLALVVWYARAVMRVHGLGVGRASVATLAGGVAQLLVAGPLIR